MNVNGRTGERFRKRGFIASLVLALLVNGLFVLLLENRIYWGDERWYMETARSLAFGQGVEPAPARVPGYPLWLGFWWSLGGGSMLWLRLSNLALGLIGAVFIYRIAREVFGGEPEARMAAFLFLAYPFNIFLRGFVLSENLLTPMLLAAVWLCIRAVANPGGGNWLAAGLVTGLTVLVRPVLLLVPLGVPLLLLFFNRTRPQPLRGIVAAVLISGCAFLAVVSVWVYRNYATSGKVMLSVKGNCEIYRGLATPIGDSITDFAASDDAESCQKAIIAEIRDHWPAVLARKAYYAARFWLPLKDHVTGQRLDSLYQAFSWLILLLLYPAAFWGWRRSQNKVAAGTIVWMIVLYWLFHVVVVVKTRYRIPVDSLLLIFAAQPLARLAESVLGKRGGLCRNK